MSDALRHFYRWQADWFVYLAMLAFMLGLIAAAALGFVVKLFPWLLVLVIVLLIISLFTRLPELLYLAFLLLGLLWGGIAAAQVASFSIPADEAVFFEGRVVEISSREENYFSQLAEYQNDGYSFVLQGKESRGWRGRIMVIASPVQPELGDRMQVSGIVREFSNTQNLNLPDSSYLTSRGISAMLQPTPDGLHFTKLAVKYSPLRLGKSLREEVYAAMQPLPALQQALLKGIGFGETGMLTNGQTSVLQQTGVMHVFAVSGLHIGYVVMLAGVVLEFIRRSLTLSYKFTLIGTALFILFFDCVVGFSPSVLRATVMLLAAFSGTLLLRPHAAARALIGAAFLLLLVRPFWLTQPGFILSFLATAGIVFTNDYWRMLVKNQALAVSFAAQAMTLPVVAYFFHVISFAGLIASPLIVLASGVVVILVLLAMLLTPFGLAFIPLAGAGLCAEGAYRLAEIFAAMPQAFQYTKSPGWGVILIYYLLLLAAYFILARLKYVKKHEEDRSGLQESSQ